MTFLDIVANIPDVVWSGVTASLLTLGGVMLANRSSTNRLKIQLAHESAEKATQRRAELRKDVYLVAAEEMVKANAHLASLPNIDLSKPEALAPIQNFFAAAAKLQMVAETPTAVHASQLVGMYGQMLFKVMQLARPIQDAKFDAELAQNSYEEAQVEIRRVLAAMTALNESGSPDSAKFAQLERSYEFSRDRAAKHNAARQAALGAATARHIDLLKSFLPSMKDAGMKGMLLMIEIRREFEIRSIESAMEDEMKAQWQRMDESLASLLRTLQ